MKSGYIDRSEGFRTHYLEWEPVTETEYMPVIGIHGNLSNARMFRWIGERLSSGAFGAPRRMVAVDLRGCGDSGMPGSGFSLRHMASDIAAAMDRLGIPAAHFISYSRGVPYTLQFALSHPGRVKALAAGDFGVRYPKLTEEWVRRVDGLYDTYDSWEELFEAVAGSEGISREIFEASKDLYYMEDAGLIRKRYLKDLPARMQRESEEQDLTPGLDAVEGPILVLQGTEPGSLLNGGLLEPYHNRGAVIVGVTGAGHDVFEPRVQVSESLESFFRRLP